MTNSAVPQAMRSLKDVQAEMVQWENRLEMLKGEISNLTRQKESLTQEIDKKVNDAQILLSTRDNESRKKATDVQAATEALTKQKTEFATVLADFKRQQNGLIDDRNKNEEMKKSLANQKVRFDAFVINLQKAYSLIG